MKYQESRFVEAGVAGDRVAGVNVLLSCKVEPCYQWSVFVVAVLLVPCYCFIFLRCGVNSGNASALYCCYLLPSCFYFPFIVKRDPCLCLFRFPCIFE